MKKTVQLLTVTVAGIALAAQTAWADTASDSTAANISLISAQAAAVSAAPSRDKPAVVLEAYDSYKNELGTLMVPLRRVAEELGYQLVWRDTTRSVDLTKDGWFTTVYEGQDAYFLNSMEPISLNGAAYNLGGALFVPLAFFREILHVQAAVDSQGAISIW